MSIAKYPYIELAEDGAPSIAGTPTKVVEIVLDRLAHNGDAGEIHRQHHHLSLAQIHAAPGYYYDHQPEIDEDIERRLQRVRFLQNDLGQSPHRARLKAASRLA